MILYDFVNLSENMDHSQDGRAVPELKAALTAHSKEIQSATDDQVYDIIDRMMTRIAKSHGISGQKLHDMWVDKYGQIPDTWIMKIKEEQQRLDPHCWTGYKKQGTKLKGGVRVNNCVPNEGVAENFADGKNPQDKGDSKRHGVPTKASVSTLRKVAKQGGRKGQLAHWMANMKSGKNKTNEAELATKNSNEIWRQLRANGYQSVGSGADSTVWAKDDNYIIKILMPEDLGNKAEQVFRKFYEFSIVHQDLTCLPRFNEVNIIDINGKDYTQIEMERLKPIEKGTFMEGVVWFFSDFCQTQTPWDKVSQAMGLSDTWEWYPYTKNSKSIANVYIKQWQDVMYNKKSYAMYRQLYNVMQLLYNAGTINKFGWDLHTANVMQRGNGQPVIIDPWFSEGTS